MSSLVLAALALLAPAAHDGDPKSDEGPRFVTNRPSDIVLPLPGEEEAFSFVVFGDRTGGPAEGIRVLEQAVEEVNVIEPDLVMTVGDLIQGYDETPKWLEQMHEFKTVMGALEAPWFPVAGNHDTYWRGPEGERPFGEHDASYETHFGPLWYAFRHKSSWFIVLYSDEGDPTTGEKSFRDPEKQRMSPEQFAWLGETLELTRDAEHVFVFLHHPRWLGQNYGDDWDRVHALLADAGNVTAVFAGHIHHMRYEGPVDGIEYFTLATVGGHEVADIPEAGYLHQYHLVTVRPERVAVAAFPVGSAFDPRAITNDVAEDCFVLQRRLDLAWGEELELQADLSAEGTVHVALTNPVEAPIEVTLVPRGDPYWSFGPEHAHARLGGGESRPFAFRARRHGTPTPIALTAPELEVRVDYLANDRRIAIPARRVSLPIDLTRLPAPAPADVEHVLACDGESAYASVPHERLALPDGPLTVEAWMRADRFASRVGLVAKTEGSEFAIFVSEGKPDFSVHLDGRYAVARTERELETDRWYHLAGVFDGAEVRLYVDGRVAARVPGAGARTVRGIPLLVGADVRGDGGPTSFFDGDVDEVRVSRGVRYATDTFEPERRFEPDEDTALLLHMDGAVGRWLHDASTERAHPVLRGTARVVAAGAAAAEGSEPSTPVEAAPGAGE